MRKTNVSAYTGKLILIIVSYVPVIDKHPVYLILVSEVMGKKEVQDP